MPSEPQYCDDCGKRLRFGEICECPACEGSFCDDCSHPYCANCDQCECRCKTCPDCDQITSFTYHCAICQNVVCENCLSCCDTCQGCHRTCERCDCCQSECDCYGEADVALETWDLPYDLDLREAAAKFYLMSYKTSVSPWYRETWMEYAEELGNIFARYLDMAIGGEIRYGSDRCPNASSYMPRVMKRYHSVTPSVMARGRAWAEWKELRDEGGIEILVEAETALLEGTWPQNSIGGAAWGGCATLLRQYLMNEINVITFVDSAFGLEHNNGCVFNKLWATHGLKAVLDKNLAGHVSLLLPYLTDEAERHEWIAWFKYGAHNIK